jgi:hypothetical protein
MPGETRRCGILAGSRRSVMSRKDAILLTSRMLSVLMTVWALGEIWYVPEVLHSYLHYGRITVSSAYSEYMQHYYLVRLSSLFTRIIGFFLLARWFQKCGADVEELFLPSPEEIPVQS